MRNSVERKLHSKTAMEGILTLRLSCYAMLACILQTTVLHQASAFNSLQGPPSKFHSTIRSKIQLYQKPPTDANTHGVCESRRVFFDQVADGFVIPASLMVVSPSVANSASPVTAQETDSIGAFTKRVLRPKPPKILRRKLSMDFAVLLMRSSYNALDKLDCVAMVSVCALHNIFFRFPSSLSRSPRDATGPASFLKDQFQRDFFLIRRSEYEPYIGALGPGVVQQGDLTDPNYFDFISFAQYRTINREITQDPPFVFEEQQPIDQGEDQPVKFVPVVIRRDPTLTNAMLGPEHSRMVGSEILDRLEEIFGNTDLSLPKILPGSKPDQGKYWLSMEGGSNAK
jgi:hypothetical protein